MMKRILPIVAALAFTLTAYAQSAGDSRKIALSSYVADNSGVPPASAQVLLSKLNSVITSSGFGAEANQRFILTPRVTILTEDVTPTTPPMYAYTLSFDLYIGDGMSGTMYSSAQVQAKGVGDTKDKAYMRALQALNPRDPAFKAFVQEGKNKIVEYYNINGASIIKRAQTLANNQQFEEAIWELSAIPEACSSYYGQANDMIAKIYQQQITQQGQSMLAEAKAIWNAGQDREAADKAGAILAQINPQSPAYKQAQALHNQIAARIKAIDNREWAFQLQQQRDETAVRKAQIQAARDVSVAWAKNQPKTVYKFYWW